MKEQMSVLRKIKPGYLLTILKAGKSLEYNGCPGRSLIRNGNGAGSGWVELYPHPYPFSKITPIPVPIPLRN